jgi:glycosyltransferase involved in cell wall biosynthesis
VGYLEEAVSAAIETLTLPPPPAERSGWPWTADLSAVSANAPDGNAWPRWSVVMPSFNQGRFMEEAIRSVLMQGYPNLELIVIDGGSNDETLDVIRKYEPWIKHWESCKDRGQTHAINKGFERATGDVLTWVNCDDVLAPGAAFAAIGKMTATGADVVGGHVRFFGDDLSYVSEVEPFVGDSMVSGRPYVFHVSFFRASAVKKVGALRESLYYAMDYEYLVRLSRAGATCAVAEQVLSNFRVHDESKTSKPGEGYACYREMSEICRSYGGPRFNHGWRTYWRCHVRYKVEHSPMAFALRGYRAVKRALSA